MKRINSIGKISCLACLVADGTGDIGIPRTCHIESRNLQWVYIDVHATPTSAVKCNAIVVFLWVKTADIDEKSVVLFWVQLTYRDVFCKLRIMREIHFGQVQLTQQEHLPENWVICQPAWKMHVPKCLYFAHCFFGPCFNYLDGAVGRCTM